MKNSPIGCPKKDKMQLSIVESFGLTQHSNQPCNIQNEVDAHLHEYDESNSVELVEIENPSKKHKIILKSKWNTRFPWAYVLKHLMVMKE